MRKLQSLNKRDIELPDINLDDILKDPEKFAIDFHEVELILALPDIIEAYKSGKQFAIELERL